MANIKISRRAVTVDSIAADFDFYAEVAGAPNIENIKFFPGAANDQLIINDADGDNAEIVNLLSTDGEGRIDRDIDGKARPVIDETASTLSAGHKVNFNLKNPVTS